MGRLINADKLRYKHSLNTVNTTMPQSFPCITKDEIDKAPTVEAIPKEEVKQFIQSIQKIKDNYNEHGEPINYGTICGILIEGYRLLSEQ